MTTFLSAQVDAPGATFGFARRDGTAPGAGRVLVKVAACGICHTDAAFVGGQLPGLQFPLTPGHEIAGRIEATGAGTDPWRPGDRVAIGWSGGYCGHCQACRDGDFIHCAEGLVTGAAFRGGYAEYVEAPASALARIPDELSAVEAAPLACAGVTMFHALRSTDAKAGETVAILGLGGLGHLGVQFAAKMGFRTVAIARGEAKRALATELGAHHYIDSTVTDVAAGLTDLGGARVIAATAANADAVAASAGGLGRHGELLVIAVLDQAVSADPMGLIMKSAAVRGHPSGSAKDIEDTLNFAALQGIRPMVEPIPLHRLQEGYQRMLAGQARFRVVLTMGDED